MKDKIFSVLQRVGRSFMLPIAILPVAGLLLGIGSSFTNATTIETYHLTSILGEGTVLNALLMIMNKVGSAVFDNLPLIFAVGVALDMAKKEKESFRVISSYRVFCNEYCDQCDADDHRTDSRQWRDCRVCTGGNHHFCMWYPVFADGCIWRYHRRTWCGSTSQ